jgi:hypothetical protein
MAAVVGDRRAMDVAFDHPLECGVEVVVLTDAQWGIRHSIADSRRARVELIGHDDRDVAVRDDTDQLLVGVHDGDDCDVCVPHHAGSVRNARVVGRRERVAHHRVVHAL